jgi:hypothetical protein
MTIIDAEGTCCEYVDSLDAAGAVAKWFPKDDGSALRLAKGVDTRLAIFRGNLPPHAGLPCFLVWQSVADLGELDRKVRAGAHSDSDFEYAFRTVRARAVCGTCNSCYSTLEVDAGEPYPNAPGLLRAKLAKISPGVCRNCGNSLRTLVAKIIEQIPLPDGWPARA